EVCVLSIRPFLPPVVAAVAALSIVATSATAATHEESGGFWSDGNLLLKTSLYTRHYSDDPRHNNHQRMVNLEWIASSEYGPGWTDRAFAHAPQTRWLVGAAAFRNSFGQDSTYLYGGFRRELSSSENTSTYVKLTGGLLHGYRGEFRDKIPFNNLGIAPA
ncbi:hypothetical protein RZS08_12145, partial [Arthrospira platensis SPKY1]|nr:hypothetical protein [Arthrospira platensis SPKY1]